MEACEWTFASWILASHRSAHNRTFNQHQVSQRLLTAPNISLELMPRNSCQPNPVPHCAPENTLWAMQQSPWPIMITMLGWDIN